MRPYGEDARLFWRAGEGALAINWRPKQSGGPFWGLDGKRTSWEPGCWQGGPCWGDARVGNFWWAVMSAPDELKWQMITVSRPGGWGLGFGPWREAWRGSAPVGSQPCFKAEAGSR